jgi:sterol desaturase/sphingolipid hydroxylase (fatty acid hydroxylase superfamily)
MDETSETAIRLSVFAGIFALIAAWEVLAPRRPLAIGRAPRWPNNLAIVVVDSVTVRLLVPTAAVGIAVVASQRGFGIFHLLAWPDWLAGMLGFVVLDLVIYAQHVTFHHVPVLWRAHRMHHADLDIDVTTGLRFHPIEIVLSMLVKMATVALLGIPAVAVVAFEVTLNATAMFNHANVSMPTWLDRVARLVVVTPDMHRTHHSVVADETNSNYGFNLPWWDWLFGTYCRAPAAGHDGMTIGLTIFRDPAELRLDRLLTQPFRTAHE